MTPRHVDLLNIGFIFLSAVLAIFLPFELFLFSYAVLGPLHYLTEIAWLKDKKFFTSGTHDAWILAGLTMWIVLTRYFITDYHWLNPTMTATAFVAALAMVCARNWRTRLMIFFLTMVPLLLFWDAGWYVVFFSLFLTTIIHVLVFTLAFMLQGALKSRSRLGYASVALFLIGAAAMLLWSPGGLTSGVTDYAREVYDGSFYGLNLQLSALFGLGELKSLGDIFFSSTGQAVMRLIAFAYTYHYLNWFSKTSIIGWGKASRQYWHLIIPLWLLSVGIYVYDYHIGVAILYFLSMLHVFLEFPLNHRSFGVIFREVGSRVR